ncbi:hypothetical protein P0Y35_13795 [Kiritimatiellaeota bacterium B1221]|nr:hypothetical protein [Kiritimatiellaeota bacterium B1221]
MKKIFCVLVCIFAVSSMGFAESKAEYSPNVVVGDGKNGNAWGQWEKSVKDAPVKEVRMRVKHIKGDKAYINLRFKGGDALDGGKRIYLTPGKEAKVSWNVGGQHPNGKPLVLNAYDGEVKILKVAVIQQ